MVLHYHIWTIGCQMNKADSARLSAYLENLGYLSSDNPEEADLIILNSCVVRQSAESRVINKLHVLKAIKKARPHLKIALTGCLVAPNDSGLKTTFPFVDYIFPAGELPEWLKQPEIDFRHPARTSVTDYIPIMQGCNNFCSYCIVPYRRGPERSRPLEEIVKETQELVSQGIREVTLLGQNVDSYGHDLAAKPDLADLLKALDSIPGLFRLRFLTNHPKDMKAKLIKTIGSLDKVCEQINLPVQAGDDVVLKAMRRGYTVRQYRALIQRIRAGVPGISITSDIIVGFPGETDPQFTNTCDLLSEIRFDQVHVAAYSVRPGTLAARELPDNVPIETKKARLAQVEKLQTAIADEINTQIKGQIVEILVEGQEKGKWSGRTRSDKPVFFTAPGNWTGQLVNVRILRTSPWSLAGELV